jgi:hypothetical protein
VVRPLASARCSSQGSIYSRGRESQRPGGGHRRIGGGVRDPQALSSGRESWGSLPGPSPGWASLGP